MTTPAAQSRQVGQSPDEGDGRTVGGEAARERLLVAGTVQGVGFRPFVYRLARDLGLGGQVANDHRGVVIEVEGRPQDLAEFAHRLRAEAPPLAAIASIASEPIEPTGDATFVITESRSAGAPAVAVSVDVATCDDCLAEMADPADRRHGYPFINCTNCGPRYTIISSIPYDRAATTMAPFVMCRDCRREYQDPGDRRFHAEPTACPRCGPLLRLLDGQGRVLATGPAALEETAALLLRGGLVALKGLGGYHLVALADDRAAVAALRASKARDAKPFAVMIPDPPSAHRLVALSPEAEAALWSARRPIVLAPRQPDAPVADDVAPGLNELGLMAPYTPLHSLLMATVARPLVMTSGNRSDEPIAHVDGDAILRLGPMVDAICTHDRGIHIRCDDSVVRSTWSAGVQMVRRSRGYAPEPLRLIPPTPVQVLAVGAELKNTVTVAKGGSMVTSHHIGDLEHPAAYRSFLQAVDHLCHLTGTEPEVVAHDLHPEYLSTKFAADLDMPLLGVQHHHAHIASCLAEHGRHHRVLGIAFDGTGMGIDQTIWGGEFLVADLAGFERVGHLAGVPMVGGDRAVREPWRMAMAWLNAAGGPEVAAAFGRTVDDRWAAVLDRILAAGSLVTTSAGRLFDAVAAILGVRTVVSYEAQAAIELEALASSEALFGNLDSRLEAASQVDGAVVLDPAALVMTLLEARDAGRCLTSLAAGFHEILGRAVAETAIGLAETHRLRSVALSGGVFQNIRFSEVVRCVLEDSGLEVLVHRQIPPNDGGISVGQAAVAAHRAATAT
ncbi:MAG: carbamoyltransferase HypF [Acidimicrobiales bacterium]